MTIMIHYVYTAIIKAVGISDLISKFRSYIEVSSVATPSASTCTHACTIVGIRILIMTLSKRNYRPAVKNQLVARSKLQYMLHLIGG